MSVVICESPVDIIAFVATVVTTEPFIKPFVESAASFRDLDISLSYIYFVTLEFSVV